MARPVTCGKCGADLRGVPGHDERLDRDGRDLVGFLECPACDAAYVYQRRRDRATPKPAPAQLALFDQGKRYGDD